MRILCLHGTGLNSSIFAAQTARLRDLLPTNYTYEWIDGPHQVEPPRLIADAHSGPYLSYMESLTTEGVADAIDALEALIQEKGPFDGAMGMSQGAMLIAALLIRRQMNARPNPVRFAIFIAGILPLSWTVSIGQAVDDVRGWRPPLVTKDPSCEWLRECGQVRCFNPGVYGERLNLPTVHVWGRGDGLRKQAEMMVRLCNPDLVGSYQHTGGHQVPQPWSDNEAVSEMIREAVMRKLIDGMAVMTYKTAAAETQAILEKKPRNTIQDAGMAS
ncbi:hypothetical protein CDD80_5086 [Ophiocordyceps camponoti-rufipedis]|uniref:Serine hydrolase domain-containing protein n=1 Tax=Ophiocordyceps camponoti-rufipedis TaxID=2004952 RepID=A0A2C5ZHH7_9HYPO|nr:hypothetical protein CDD80_5086 [Ophiocordyceps camponoti-rufipedis]